MKQLSILMLKQKWCHPMKTNGYCWHTFWSVHTDDCYGTVKNRQDTHTYY